VVRQLRAFNCHTEENAICVEKGGRNKYLLPWKNRVNCVVSLTKDPQPIPKRFFHTVRSGASSFNFQNFLVPLRPYNSLLRRIPHLLIPSMNIQLCVLEGSS
jgi:hypothetical protein